MRKWYKDVKSARRDVERCFQAIPSLLFHRHCLGRARAHRDMLIIEFSPQKECSKIGRKAWISSWYGHCIDHVYYSVLKRLDTAHPSVIVYMLCIVQETFL